jgi:hypothetical protein
VAHRTVRCTTEQPLFLSGARSPSNSGAADRCRFVAVGAPDIVRCTPDSPVPPANRWRGPRVARGLRDRPLLWRPLAHRTVRCTTGSPVNYSRTPPNSPESGLFTGVQPGAPDTVRCARLNWTLAELSQVFCISFLLFFSLFLVLRQNILVLKNQCTKSRNIPSLCFALLSSFDTKELN